MSFTYAGGSGGGTITNPPYSLLTPIKVTNTPALFTPRVAINNSGTSIGPGGALTFNFEVGTDINGIAFQFSNNRPRDGFMNNNGQSGVNPGWQLRCLIYNADSTTGLPSTLRNDYGAQNLYNTNDGGQQQGLIGWETGLYIPANTPIWVLIAGQPLWQDNLPNGFFDGTTYSWDGSQWNQDNGGGYLTSPDSPSWTTELDPIVTLPIPEKNIYAFGQRPMKMSVTNTWGPLYDYTSVGAPTGAINLQTATPPSTWLPDHDFITNVDFAHTATNGGLLPIIEAIID